MPHNENYGKAARKAARKTGWRHPDLVRPDIPQNICYSFPMQVVLIILSVGLTGLIIYFAVSPKSSRLLKITAFIALALSGLSLGVAGIFLIIGPGEGSEFIPLPVFQEFQPPPAKSGNTLAVVVFFMVFLGVLGLIIALALREQRKKDQKAKKAPVFPDDAGLNDRLSIDGPNLKEEDSFEIEIE